MEVVATQDGDRVEVSVKEDRSDGWNLHFGPHEARLVVSVPPHASVEAASGDGRIDVRDLDGELVVRTGDGAIRLEHVSGAVDARSGDGSIVVEGALKRLRVRSGDGRVVVRAARGTAPDGEWNISTGDGAVVLEVPEGFGAELDASTGDGRVSVADIPFNGGSSSRERRVARGRIGDGGPNIRIRSGDGSTDDLRPRESPRELPLRIVGRIGHSRLYERVVTLTALAAGAAVSGKAFLPGHGIHARQREVEPHARLHSPLDHVGFFHPRIGRHNLDPMREPE
jgi:hypothetical protein